MRRRRRFPNGTNGRYEPVDLVSLDLSEEEVMAELDPGWSSWCPDKIERDVRTAGGPLRDINGEVGMREITFDTRHQGPFGAVNGGYLAGVLGETLGDRTSSVRINEAVPTNTTLSLFAGNDEVQLRRGERTVALATLTSDPIPPTRFVPIDQIAAALHPDFAMGMFADCFVCSRPGPDGLGVAMAQLGDGRFAAIWRPVASNHIDGPEVPARYLRAALDCPGGFAVVNSSQKLAVTGTLTSQVNFLPRSDETLLVVGEATYVEGRKHGAVTTIFTESAEVVATASAVWVALGEIPVDTASESRALVSSRGG